MVRRSVFLGALLFSILGVRATAPEKRASHNVREDVFAAPGFVFEEDCCIQVAVFLARFAREHPGEKARLVRVTAPGGRNHALAAFSEGDRVRFWDQSAGVLPGADTVADFESRACTRAAQARYNILLRGMIARGAFPEPKFFTPRGAAKQLGYLETIRDSLPDELRAEMFSAIDDAGRVRHVLGFRAGSLWGVYAAGVGAVLTDLERMGVERESPDERKLTFVARVAGKVFHQEIRIARLHAPESPTVAADPSQSPALG